jgi:hypothetical protein
LRPTKSSVKITHKPVETFTPGMRIDIQVQVKDPNGVDIVRCYFKTPEAANHVFVPMTNDGGRDYKGVLPAPDRNTQAIEYLFLVVSGNAQVVKSQTFTMSRSTKSPTAAEYQDQITVYTEVAQTQPPTGFSDNIVLDAVESGARFGLVVTGLYSADAAAGAASTGAAASATSGGNVVAGTVFWNTTIAIAATAAAVGVGAAAANSSSDDDSGGSALADISQQTIAGTWSVSGVRTDGATASGTITFNNNSTFSYALSDSGTGVGSWSLTNSILTMRFDAGAIYSGPASGNSQNFTLNSTNNGWVLTFTR